MTIDHLLCEGGGLPGQDDVCRRLLGIHRGIPLLVPRQVQYSTVQQLIGSGGYMRFGSRFRADTE